MQHLPPALMMVGTFNWLGAFTNLRSNTAKMLLVLFHSLSEVGRGITLTQKGHNILTIASFGDKFTPDFG